jgi:hypothetical protein
VTGNTYQRTLVLECLSRISNVRVQSHDMAQLTYVVFSHNPLKRYGNTPIRPVVDVAAGNEQNVKE